MVFSTSGVDPFTLATDGCEEIYIYISLEQLSFSWIKIPGESVPFFSFVSDENSYERAARRESGWTPFDFRDDGSTVTGYCRFAIILANTRGELARISCELYARERGDSSRETLCRPPSDRALVGRRRHTSDAFLHNAHARGISLYVIIT